MGLEGKKSEFPYMPATFLVNQGASIIPFLLACYSLSDIMQLKLQCIRYIINEG